jgi:Fe-S cluster assembly protein SufD
LAKAEAALAEKLDLDVITALAAAEPVWLREVREAAFERFERIPLPTDRTEGWRRLDLARIDLTPALPEPSNFTVAISNADRARGIIAMPLSKAIESHELLVQEAQLQARGGRALNKYASLAEAAWLGGSFIHVPNGVEMSEPIFVEVEHGTYPHLVVSVGTNARAAIAEVHRERGRFVSGISDIAVGAGAHLTYAHVQQCGPQTVVFSHQHAGIADNAKLVTFNVGAGGLFAKTEVAVELLGRGAESDMLGLVDGRGSQQFDYHTLQGHRSSDTRSDLLFKSALDGRAHSIYTGVIVIAKGAQRSDAYQANRNLLLDEGARADTEPMLEIEADDVRCTHGATVGPIDAEQLFYLGTRGMARDAASRLIVEGFFQDVLDKVGDARLTRPLEAVFAPHLAREA